MYTTVMNHIKSYDNTVLKRLHFPANVIVFKSVRSTLSCYNVLSLKTWENSSIVNKSYSPWSEVGTVVA